MIGIFAILSADGKANCQGNKCVISHTMLKKLVIDVLVSFCYIMMTSSNGSIFRVTGLLCGEFTGPRTKASDTVLFMFSLICVWINGWVKNREAGDLRRHCTHYDVTAMMKSRNHIAYRSFSLTYTWHVSPHHRCGALGQFQSDVTVLTCNLAALRLRVVLRW